VNEKGGLGTRIKKPWKEGKKDAEKSFLYISKEKKAKSLIGMPKKIEKRRLKATAGKET